MDIPLEQLVYGSFPFRGGGYDVLARSPGCRADWTAEVLAACRRFGEAPSGVTPSPALFALRLPSGPWAIVGVGPQGLDDRGRPGALAFHALLVAPRDYCRAGSDPFAFAGALRRDWSAGSTLDAISWPVDARSPRPAGPPTDPRARRVARALSTGRRVAIESPGPVDALAREVWLALPDSARRKASLATWAFGNANRFDFVALPRMAGIELDRSYLDPASVDAEPPATADPPTPVRAGSPGRADGGSPLRWPCSASRGPGGPSIARGGMACRRARPGDPASHRGRRRRSSSRRSGRGSGRGSLRGWRLWPGDSRSAGRTTPGR